MILGDAVPKLETFVWILNHISRPITWSLFILKTSYLVTNYGQMTNHNIARVFTRGVYLGFVFTLLK